ncbi:MAG: PolC-type DNA polymerase III [Clostridia bacterium]|nr:PolC-type DNA polymerase III [Clostridia bacterium]
MLHLSELFPEIWGNVKFDGEITNTKLYKDLREIYVNAKFNQFIKSDTLTEICQKIKDSYNLNAVEIAPVFSSECYSKELMPEIIKYIKDADVAMFLQNGQFSFDGDNINIKFNCSLIEKDFKGALTNKIKDLFDVDVTVTSSGISEESAREELENFQREVEQTKAEIAKQKVKENSTIIYGRKIKDTDIMPIADINELSGNVVIEGEIFTKEIDVRITRDKKYIVIFPVTDYTNSISCKIFIDSQQVYESVSERLKKGVYIRIKGNVGYDKYSREIVLSVYDINEAVKTERTDNAEEKRVELHLHTQMSSMDSTVNIDQLIKNCKRFGHKAIAVTDHGVVQAFPFMMNATQKTDIKVLYGCEVYLVNIGKPIVFCADGQSLTKSVVVFDTETTGLNKETEEIIEIGAVKIQDGEIVDRFSTFINPKKPIPSKIVELTNITDDMVKDAPFIETVMPQFLEFCKDSVLVAHNASFDIGFVKETAKRLGIEGFAHTYIDTVELARGFLPDLPKHKLDFVAKALNISLEGHHRAVNDAETTAQIYLEFARRLNDMEITTTDDVNTAFDEEKDPKKKGYHHAVVFAKNYTGLKNLYKIISASHLESFYKRPRVTKALYLKYCDGLIIGSACEQGELYRSIQQGKSNKEVAAIARFYDYLEIQPLGNNEFMIRKNIVENKEKLIEINKRIINLGEFFGKPVVATCDVHFLEPRDSIYRAILQKGQGYDDADSQAPLYYRTTEEMLSEFSYLPPEKAYEIVVTNTNKIADMCEKMLPVPDGTFPPVWPNAPDEIKEMSEAKAKRIYGEDLPEIVRARMDKELHSIITYGFSVMYLIAQRLVKKSNEDGYLVGSRGSVGSSFVAFLSDITEVNALPPHYVCKKCQYSEFITDGSYGCGVDMPDKVCPKCGEMLYKDGHDIPFETFLGFAGDKEPDIDLNFSGDYQPKAHKYTEVLFGEGHVFRAGTIATLADKTAYGFVKKYLDEKGIVASNAEIDRLISGVGGVKRTTGQHPGGVMILPKGHDIHEFCPVQHPADDNDTDIITTHFDYHSISGRLLKLDILGHDDPTVIRMLEDLTGIDAKTIPLDDKDTMSLFLNTEALGVTEDDIGSPVGTFGVPEFGTKFVRQMLVDTKPTTFSELCRISGLSHGTDVWLNNAQDLINQGVCSLKDAICTRDDIMIYLMYAGVPAKNAFDIMEHVRKGKGLKQDEIDILNENNIPQWYIDSCQKIKYMFPKAHAVAYVTMAFRIAWFKVHYPKAYYIAHLTVRADEFDSSIMCNKESAWAERRRLDALGRDASAKDKNVLTILEIVCEMFARGIEFDNIDLYKSDAVKFTGTEKGIMPPLNALPGLGANAAVSIVEARKDGEFSSIEDLRNRSKVNKTVIELMKEQGVLDGMPESNQLTFF